MATKQIINNTNCTVNITQNITQIIEPNKRCSKCRIVKPVSEFSKNRSTKDGYQKQCKSCMKTANKENREKHKEKNCCS
jgi:hypothetical protein